MPNQVWMVSQLISPNLIKINAMNLPLIIIGSLSCGFHNKSIKSSQQVEHLFHIESIAK